MHNMPLSSFFVILFAVTAAVSTHDYHFMRDYHPKKDVGTYQQGTIYLDPQQQVFVFKPDVIDKVNGVAYGSYNNTLNATGWGVLEIYAHCPNSSCSNSDAMYAAGMLEGVFTATQIWQNYQNIRPFYLSEKDKKLENLLRSFFNKQDAWMRTMIKQQASTDPFWMNVNYILSQLDGLYMGYQAFADKSWEVDYFVVQFLNAVGDILDLRKALIPSNRPDFAHMTRQAFEHYAQTSGHCSALVKVTAGYENLFLSHSSWFIYASTMRIYKHYHFHLDDASLAARSISFSSYPGFLESLDDFYLMSSKMVMLQTTINVYNNSLYDNVTFESLLAWQRVRVANSMARSGPEWYKYVSRYNSGTYNNQYMVIDLKKFKPKATLEDDALWVVEQMPGIVAGADQTQILRTGYWPSYNVPFYEVIYNVSGTASVAAQCGPECSYELAPRAKIFRRDAGSVDSLNDIKNIMRYNDYKHDNYSEGDPCKTICCRGDLKPGSSQLNVMSSAIGCYDTKVTDVYMALKMTSYVINGPTTSHSLPPFSWTGSFKNESHIGLPEVYNFGWERMSPTL